ncbi:MAG: undecaprenyl-diphosphate phosphatase [Planctomycetota bacterium]|nr:MAG: undecaprenyl-diphosphate phosphatase [Planctomycetota bacterium]
MSDYWVAVLVGIVEGLTEFLPVSSTAHIVLSQAALGMRLDDPFWKMFSVVIQLGAILSVVVYFWPRLVSFVQSFLTNVQQKGSDSNPSSVPWWKHPLALVIISFVVTAIPCFLMDELIGENLERPWVIGASLLLGGIAMLWIDQRYSQTASTHSVEQMTLRQAIFIGAAQILAAMFPGTSRSMATIAGGQIMGLSRPAALEFSFFLSIPVMFAASGFKFLQFLVKSPIQIDSRQWLTLGIGFVTSFLVALAVIAWFMQWVRSRGFAPFAIYRMVLGVAVILWLGR